MVRSWKTATGVLTWELPQLMGILNVTPDSFSDGGRFTDSESALQHAIAMEEAGALIIDVGGESTRPGSGAVSAVEEKKRVLPIIAQMRDQVPCALSIDTSKAEVARAAIEAGASIVNDITACSDPEMISLIAETGAGIVLMHMQGEPRTMQTDPQYGDVVTEVGAFLWGRAKSLVDAGVDPEQIVIDPGIGFGKTLEHNLMLMATPRLLRWRDRPLLFGTSRKSWLKKLLDADVNQRLPGSLASAAHLATSGVDFLRVHDVAETMDLLAVLDALEAHR